jgi:hypothetical protein
MFPFLLLLCGFNLLGSLHIIHFTAVVYGNQLSAVKCFLEKIAMMGNVIGVPQNMEYVFRVPQNMEYVFRVPSVKQS